MEENIQDENLEMFDVKPAHKSFPDIFKIGKYEKFINFKIYKCEETGEKICQTPEELTLFHSSYLKVDKLTNDDKKNSLKNMIKALEKHIESEIKLQIEKIKFKVCEKYKLNEMKEALRKMEYETE